LLKIEISVNKINREFFCFFEKDKCQFSERDNPQSGHEASTSTLNLQQTAKRVCADMLTEAGGSKKRQGEFACQYGKNTCNLALL